MVGVCYDTYDSTRPCLVLLGGLNNKKMKNKEMTPFIQFIESENGSKVRSFFEYIMNEDTPCDVIVFLTRKGYWLYRIYCWYYGIKIDHKIICSDRKIDKGDIQEIKKLSGKDNATVYIVDDTLSSGVTANKIYKVIKSEWTDANIIPVACFMSASSDNIKDNFNDSVLDEEFIHQLCYFSKSTPWELGNLSFEQAKLAQSELMPYVVDLPFLVTDSYDCEQRIAGLSKDIDETNNNRFSILKREKFIELCKGV